MAFTNEQESGQPAHLCRLTRVFAVCNIDSLGPIDLLIQAGKTSVILE